MSRFLPLVLLPFIAVSAWRREAGLPMMKPRTPEAHKSSAAHAITDDVAREVPEAALSARPAHRGPVGWEEREKELKQQVAMLETELRLAQEKVDAHRAKLTKVLNRRGPDPEALLTYALTISQERVMELEAQLELLEAAHVERVAPLRRSD
jgi:hypothetical protein